MVDLEPGGGGLGPDVPELLAQPVILSLAPDGELACWEAVPAPAGSSEDGDLARQLCAFRAALLLEVTVPPSAQQSVGFQLEGAEGPIFLVASFESALEARLCAQAVGSVTGAPLAEGALPEVAGWVDPVSTLDLADSFPPSAGRASATVVGTACWTDELDVGSVCQASSQVEASLPPPLPADAVFAKLGAPRFETDIEAFLLELDKLAGFN